MVETMYCEQNKTGNIMVNTEREHSNKLYEAK